MHFHSYLHEVRVGKLRFLNMKKNEENMKKFNYQIVSIMIFPKPVMSSQFLPTVCGRIAFERNPFPESSASL